MSLIRNINPQRQNSDFIVQGEPYTKGWYLTGLNIPQASLSSGFKVEIKFSTPPTQITNLVLMKLGGIYSSMVPFKEGLSILMNGNSFKVKRKVKLYGLEEENFMYFPRDTNFVEFPKNYILTFEIDETRCRIGIAEQTHTPQFKYDYDYSGLFYSYLRDVLSGQSVMLFYNPAVCIDTRAQVRDISVFALDNGVEPPIFNHPSDIVNLTNQNSLHEIIPPDGSFLEGAELVQESSYPTIWAMWELLPTFQRDRLTTDYNVKVRSFQSNKYMVVKNGDPTNLTPIIQWSGDGNNNSIWSLKRDNNNTSLFKMQNKLTDGFVVVKNASTQPEEKIVEYNSANNPNGHWIMPDVSVPNSVQTGYYRIRNKNSGLYLTFYDSWLRQYYELQWTKCDWYVEKQPGGFYTIRNVEANKQIYTYPNRTQYSYPYLQADTIYHRDGNTGLNLWIIDITSNGYIIKSPHMNEYVVVQDAARWASAYAILYPTASTLNSFWEFYPVNYMQHIIPGGMFKLKNKYTNTYLVIQNASLISGASAVTYSTANTPNGWFTFIKDEEGLFLIQNINSGQYLCVSGKSTSEGAYVLQTSSLDKIDVGYEKWKIRWIDDYNGYFIQNANSGYTMCIYNDVSTDLAPIVQRRTGTDNCCWELEQVPLPN